MIYRQFYLFFFLFSLSLSLEATDVSGVVYYERIHPKNLGTASYLDKDNITKERAKEVQVEAIDPMGNRIASTFTDRDGVYILNDIADFSRIKIRVSAKMFKKNRWDVKVIDNTNGDALYVIEGSIFDVGSTNKIRDLTATTSNQSSAPFAILDSIYQAMQKIDKVDKKIDLPPLRINWSVNNINSGTYYDGEDNIVLQGDQKGDSDEYDDHIIIHEWGHFFETKFSRADNIGGSHGTGNYLDIRVSFGEGFGNALSAMVTDDPIYFDTFGSNGWNMNIEQAYHDTPGWFSEASIQRILYDLYDGHDDGEDRLSLGFKPIYQILIDEQKDTPAFTSIFSFINALKEKTPSDTEKIDAITASEEIATIEDAYGSDRLATVKESTLPLYRDLIINQTLNNLCTINSYGIYNKLGNHKYIRFTIKEDDTYPIVIKASKGRDSDPDFVLFKTDPFEKISVQDSDSAGEENVHLALAQGDYLLDLFDASYQNESCFNILIGNDIEESNGSSTSSVGFGLPKNNFFAIFILLTILFVPLIFIRKELKV
jgi:uncharacterized protein YxjI